MQSPRQRHRIRAASLHAGIGLAGLMLFAAAAVATPPAPSSASVPHGAAAGFGGEEASPEARRIAAWILASGDNGRLPFVIVDKINAKVFAFGDRGDMRGTAPVLLGRASGDISPPGIGTRKLADIPPADRITPSGRFVAGLGPDLGTQDVLWVDYDAAISLHRVFTGKPPERRLARLATPSPLDNRISYGCINVPVLFYETVIHPLFARGPGVVYILPDRLALDEAFPGLSAMSANAAIPPEAPVARISAGGSADSPF